MFLYDFDTLGIIYTAVSGALIVMLLASVICIGVKKKPCTKGTVFFRVFDVIVCVALVAAWVMFILVYAGVLPAWLVGIALIWSSGLGILLISLTTALAITSLVLAFVLRRKAERKETVVLNPEASLPAEGQNMLFELMADLDDETSAEPLGETAKTVSAAEEKQPAAIAEITVEPLLTKTTETDEPFGVIAPELPAMRKLTVSSKGDAAKLFNTYLDEKSQEERETLSESIDEITVK